MLTTPPLTLYVHLPWCVRKCPYCDFNSHQARGELPFDAYVDALLADLDHDLPLAWGRPVHAVFFGGGTPSLFPPAAIDRFLQGASARLRFMPGLEITLETNPGTAEHGRFADYLAAGVNRLSFGIQSFDDGCLQRLGRIHDSAQAEAAVKQAQDAGFDNLNLDLMYALPGQDLSMAMRDLDRALALQPAHISHYQLTLEPNTVFAARPPSGIPDEDSAWDIQEQGQALLAEAGFAQYEVSAYARDGRRCQHNLNYWQFGDYLAAGAGAHGKFTDDDGSIWRYRKPPNPSSYMQKFESGTLDVPKQRLLPRDIAFEFMLNALRLTRGFKKKQFTGRTGLPLSLVLPGVARAESLGLLWCGVGEDGESLVVPTAHGRRFLNDLQALFLPEPAAAQAAPAQAMP